MHIFAYVFFFFFNVTCIGKTYLLNISKDVLMSSTARSWMPVRHPEKVSVVQVTAMPRAILFLFEKFEMDFLDQDKIIHVFGPPVLG